MWRGFWAIVDAFRARNSHPLFVVITGLVPAIHAEVRRIARINRAMTMEGREKGMVSPMLGSKVVR